MGNVCIVRLRILHTKLPNSHYESSTAHLKAQQFAIFLG